MGDRFKGLKPNMGLKTGNIVVLPTRFDIEPKSHRGDKKKQQSIF